jgi:hypothetical protein
MARWIHKDVARKYGLDTDVVHKIYAAVQVAKKQGLHGGHYADYVERAIGRKLAGNEYTVASKAKEHLGYDPPGGYQGPTPRGAAAEPSRDRDRKKTDRAEQLMSHADSTIRRIIDKRNRLQAWEGDRDLLKDAADELDVAADLFEEANAKLSAGTLRQRAKYARAGNVEMLEIYNR